MSTIDCIQHHQPITTGVVKSADLFWSVCSFSLINADFDPWVAFGAGKNHTHDSINAVCSSLGERKSYPCSCFTPYQDEIQRQYSEEKENRSGKGGIPTRKLLVTLVHLGTHPFEQLSSHSEPFQRIERLVIIVYDKMSNTLMLTLPELSCSARKGKLWI